MKRLAPPISRSFAAMWIEANCRTAQTKSNSKNVIHQPGSKACALVVDQMYTLDRKLWHVWSCTGCPPPSSFLNHPVWLKALPMKTYTQKVPYYRNMYTKLHQIPSEFALQAKFPLSAGLIICTTVQMRKYRKMARRKCHKHRIFVIYHQNDIWWVAREAAKVLKIPCR